MDDDLAEVRAGSEQAITPEDGPDKQSEEIIRLTDNFQSRLVVANLRTEAVRAGMVDLDGLKLFDLSAVRLGADDRIVGGRKLMDDLRRSKPWLFAPTSSSSAASAPASQPARHRSALEMTDKEYAAARKVVTQYQF